MIQSFFGMNFFAFNASRSALVMSGNLWIFAAATIPMTVCIFAAWAIWVSTQTVRLTRDPGQKPGTAPAKSIEAQMEFELPDWEKEMASGPCYGQLPGTAF